jgi:hypothetical protein
VRADAKRLCVSKHIGDGSREILRGNAAARPGAVLEHEGVVPVSADGCGVRKSFVDGADIGEASARRDDREGRSWFPSKEEQSRTGLRRLLLLLVLRVQVIEDGVAAAVVRARRRTPRRSSRSVAPTEAGQQLISRLGPALGEVESVLDEIVELRERPTGRVRLLVTPISATMVLAPRLLDFGRIHRTISPLTDALPCAGARRDPIAGSSRQEMRPSSST